MKRRLTFIGIVAAVVLVCSLIFVGCTENSVNSTIRYYGKVVYSRINSVQFDVIVTNGEKIHCITQTDEYGDFSLTVKVDEIDESYYLSIGLLDYDYYEFKRITLSGFGQAEVNLGIIQITDQDSY